MLSEVQIVKGSQLENDPVCVPVGVVHVIVWRILPINWNV